MSDFTKSKMSGHDNWATPQELYQALDEEFHFTDDPCPLMGADNADGLLREWGDVVYMNPPYSKPEPWVMKAVIEMRRGKTIVGVLRGDTSTKWFHRWVLPYAELRFIKGRLKFNDVGPAPFASIIAIWRNKVTP